MQTFSSSLSADVGGKSSKVSISGTSAQSVSFTGSSTGGTVMVTPDTNCFFRFGTNPTSVADGTDIILLASNTYRIQFGGTGKFAFITSGSTGTVYLTQEGV
jgi:hypothetical protein